MRVAAAVPSESGEEPQLLPLVLPIQVLLCINISKQLWPIEKHQRQNHEEN